MISAFMLAMLVSAVPDEPKGAEDKPVKERKVCRSEVDTGSRLGKRQVCRTAAEWQVIDDANSEALESRRRAGN